MLDASQVIPAAVSLVCSIAIGVKGKTLGVPYWQQANATREQRANADQQ